MQERSVPPFAPLRKLTWDMNNNRETSVFVRISVSNNALSWFCLAWSNNWSHSTDYSPGSRESNPCHRLYSTAPVSRNWEPPPQHPVAERWTEDHGQWSKNEPVGQWNATDYKSAGMIPFPLRWSVQCSSSSHAADPPERSLGFPTVSHAVLVVFFFLIPGVFDFRRFSFAQ